MYPFICLWFSLLCTFVLWSRYTAHINLMFVDGWVRVVQVNLHEVTATFLLHLTNKWDALVRAASRNKRGLHDDDFELLDLNQPASVPPWPPGGRGGRRWGWAQDMSKVVVRGTMLKLNLKRKYKGELESMREDAYFQMAHEALLANLVIYYLELLPAFALPGLVLFFSPLPLPASLPRQSFSSS